MIFIPIALRSDIYDRLWVDLPSGAIKLSQWYRRHTNAIVPSPLTAKVQVIGIPDPEQVRVRRL